MLFEPLAVSETTKKYFVLLFLLFVIILPLLAPSWIIMHVSITKNKLWMLSRFKVELAQSECAKVYFMTVLSVCLVGFGFFFLFPPVYLMRKIISQSEEGVKTTWYFHFLRCTMASDVAFLWKESNVESYTAICDWKWNAVLDLCHIKLWFVIWMTKERHIFFFQIISHVFFVFNMWTGVCIFLNKFLVIVAIAKLCLVCWQISRINLSKWVFWSSVHPSDEDVVIFLLTWPWGLFQCNVVGIMNGWWRTTVPKH